ncbi:MAG: hypothetical protein K0S99_3756 [Thermomicrobiales bacterium]|nr:hypothetical protein [Thermomicrobiales bacterium]
MSDRARYTWEHGLERNCPVHRRRKNTLMIFVGVLPSGNLGQATLLPSTDGRMSVHWRVGLRHSAGVLLRYFAAINGGWLHAGYPARECEIITVPNGPIATSA